MAYIVAFDTNDINVLKKAFSCYRIKDDFWHDSMITARQHILEDISQIITSGFNTEKVNHEMNKLYSFQEYVQECCEEWVVYRNEPDTCKSFQRRFEKACKNLWIDVNEVQSYYDNVFAIKRQHDDEKRLEKERLDATSGTVAKYNPKKPRKKTKTELVADERREEEYIDVVNEFAEALECCSRWKHLIVLNPDLYDDEGDCMQSFLEDCKDIDNGHVFAIISDMDCWGVTNEE